MTPDLTQEYQRELKQLEKKLGRDEARHLRIVKRGTALSQQMTNRCIREQARAAARIFRDFQRQATKAQRAEAQDLKPLNAGIAATLKRIAVLRQRLGLQD